MSTFLFLMLILLPMAAIACLGLDNKRIVHVDSGVNESEDFLVNVVGGLGVDIAGGLVDEGAQLFDIFHVCFIIYFYLYM